MPSPRKPPRRTRERILEVSLRLFNELGEPQVSTGLIAAQMGISAGNLHYHFRSRDALIAALFDLYEREIDALLALPDGRPADVEDAWLFLHLLFETIWRHRFVYRDLADLLVSSRRIGTRFRGVLERKSGAARRLCHGLADAGRLDAADFEIEALATNMVVVATWWLSYEHARDARHFNEPERASAAIGRGAFQVIALIGPYLRADARLLFERLAQAYLHPQHPVAERVG